MGKKRASYSAEFKREAVRLVAEQGLTVVQVAADLGVSRNTLYAWVRDLEAEVAPNGKPMSEQEELRQLRKEVARLKLERARVAWKLHSHAADTAWQAPGQLSSARSSQQLVRLTSGPGGLLHRGPRIFVM